MDLVRPRSPLASPIHRLTSSITHDDVYTWNWSYRMIEIHSGWRRGRLIFLPHCEFFRA
jgi:hypothetical protein